MIDPLDYLITGRTWNDPPVEIGEESFSETRILQNSTRVRSAKGWAFSCNRAILLQTVSSPEVPVRISVAVFSGEPLVDLAFESEGRPRAKLVEASVYHWSIQHGFLVEEGWSVVLEPQFSPNGSQVAHVSIAGRRA